MRLGEVVDRTATTIPLPDTSSGVSRREVFLVAEIHSIHEDHPRWNRSVAVYLRSTGGSFEVVGIERESDPPNAVM